MMSWLDRLKCFINKEDKKRACDTAGAVEFGDDGSEEIRTVPKMNHCESNSFLKFGDVLGNFWSQLGIRSTLGLSKDSK